MTWRDQQLEVQPVRSILRASNGELAIELQSRGWDVSKDVKCAPGMTGTLKGLPSIPMARELEKRVGAKVCERPEGAR
jgi:hypothetical protein